MNAATSVTTNFAVTQTSNVDCLFSWAEKNYPSLFAPSMSPTQFWTVYTYRYYSATNAYLAVNSINNHVYYMGPDGSLQDEGPLSYWSPQAGCQVPPPLRPNVYSIGRKEILQPCLRRPILPGGFRPSTGHIATIKLPTPT